LPFNKLTKNKNQRFKRNVNDLYDSKNNHHVILKRRIDYKYNYKSFENDFLIPKSSPRLFNYENK
jgi:hypothetical protein